MKILFVISQVTASLLLLVSTRSALLAQNGAIQLTLKGGWASPSEPVRKVQVAGSYTYLVVGDTGLQVLDVSSLTNPVPLGRYDAVQRINGIHVVGLHAFLATGGSITDTHPGRLEILDVSQPTNLVFLSGIETRERANNVCVTENLAYVAEGTWWCEPNRVGAVEIFSVTNPAHPTVVGRYDASEPVNDMKVVDGYAYLAGGGAALTILDVSDSRSPVWVGEFSTNNISGGEVHGLAIELNDQYAFCSFNPEGFFILDIRDRSRPLLISEFSPFSEGALDYGLSVHVVEHFAFVVVQAYDPETGLWAFLFFFVADPSNLSTLADLMHHALGRFNEPASLVDLQLANGHAYMAVTGGLLVYEFTELPYFKSISQNAENIAPTWNTLPGLKLQSSPSLTNPDWTDVPGSLGTNRIELPRDGEARFFRLVQPASP